MYGQQNNPFAAMIPEARFETLEELKEEFYKANRPWWKLYEGKKRPTGSRAASVYAMNDDTSDMDEAWESLLEAITKPLMRGKKMGVSLFSMKSTTAKGANDKHPIDLDIILPQIWLQKNGAMMTMGMNGMGMGSMGGMYGQAPMGFVHKDEIEERIQRALEKERNSREIKDLKDEIESLRGEQQSFGSKGLDYLAGVLEEPLREIGMAGGAYVKALAVSKVRQTQQGGNVAMTGIQGEQPQSETSSPSAKATPTDEQQERAMRWRDAVNTFCAIANHNGRDALVDFETFLSYLSADENNYLIVISNLPTNG